MNQIKLNWVTKIFFKFAPHTFMGHFARKTGVDDMLYPLDAAFRKAATVEIETLGGNGAQRGFMLILDRKLSFWFYQDGDHFSYDGFEMGEYEKGDVTVFDGGR